MMMKDDSEDRPWWMLLWSLFERALLTYERAPAAFIASALVFSLPALAYNVFNPPLDIYSSTVVACILYMGAFVCSGAAATLVVRGLQRGSAPTAGQAIAGVMGAFVPLAATCIVAGVLEALGLCALVVPGIVVLFWILFAGPVTLEEGLQGWPAIQRGRTLVGDGRWIQIGAVLLIAGLTRFIFGMLPMLGVRVYVMLTHKESIGWFFTAWSCLLDVVVISFLSAWVGCAYFDTVEMVRASEKPPAPPAGPTPRSRPTAAPPGAGPSRPPGSGRGR